MQRVSLTILIYLYLLLFTNLSAQELKWESSLSVAFEKSALQKKPLMVLVEKEHCRWCKKMKSETLSDRNISKRLDDFVLVKVDKNDIDSDELPYARYVPTIYLFSPKKELLIKVSGYYVVEDFDSYLDDFYEKMR
ncbi:hypothetical protein MNB_SV-6-1699 [hydrothermal vent metagenome]|uniref:DUF255 domain-containing protein n=1 Tax=hydrothermal vent metagenome TaxID=652676 RepID=A0A1W1BSB6_9ZZZZ